MKRPTECRAAWAVSLVLGAALLGCDAPQPGTVDDVRSTSWVATAVNLSPAQWPEGEWAKYIEIENTERPGNPEAIGSKGAVSGSYHGLAQRAGFEALLQGGSSVDAAMTTAMAQIALGAGAGISYFGIMGMVHYDAASGEAVSMNAVWNSVRNETDPLSIPGIRDGDFFGDDSEPSGRTALVGGFMKGAEAAHRRYGKLPWAEILSPAIFIAEEGIPFNFKLNLYLENRKEHLSRLPESKALITKADGEYYEIGDHFTQPALARTLRAVAEQGADYMHSGDWARKAVSLIRADGGKMTLEDLAAYEVTWSEPIVADHAGHQVYAYNNEGGYGGVNMIEALHLAEAAGIAELGHWSRNPESYRRVQNLLTASAIPFMPEDLLAATYPGLDLSLGERLKPETAGELWRRMEAGAVLMAFAQKPSHSDTVVAVDQWGNMTAVTHSINCVFWGRTGIIVDGVSIGDPASFQQSLIASVEPGSRLPDPIEAGLIVRDGNPIAPFASMHGGLHYQTLQSLVNVMDFGMTPKEALDAPAILVPGSALTGPGRLASAVMQGDFDAGLLEQVEYEIKQVPEEQRFWHEGLWVGIHRDPETGEVRAASHAHTNARALAH